MLPKAVDHVRHHRGRPDNDGTYTGAASPVDQARQHRARAAVAGERDKLLKHGTQRIDANKMAPRSSKERARALLIAASLALFGMFGYAVMMHQWFMVFHKSFAQTMVVLTVFLLTSSGMAIASSRRALGKDRPWLRCLGGLLATSTTIGCLVGFDLYYHHIVYYWKYSEMRTYTNVAAAQNSDAFQDGGIFLFTQDTKVDTSQAVGYQSRWTGKTYCTAPVIDSTMGASDNIYYWAIGEGCCQARASFYCDDAMDQSTRSALVVLQPSDLVRPWMQWAVQDSEWDDFMSAIKLSMGNYFIKAAPKPSLLFWTKDPLIFMNSYFARAKQTATSVGMIYACAQLAVCYMLAWTLMPKQKNQAVLRQPS